MGSNNLPAVPPFGMLSHITRDTILGGLGLDDSDTFVNRDVALLLLGFLRVEEHHQILERIYVSLHGVPYSPYISMARNRTYIPGHL